MSENNDKTDQVDGFEKARAAILQESLTMAPFDGWTTRVVEAAARAAGFSPETASAAFPNGERDLLRYWSARLDEGVANAMAAPGFSEQKIREKVAAGVLARIDAMRPHKEAARRAAALLATPAMAPLGARLTWASADVIWRALGDKSTDFNFYSKRAILSGVLTSTTTRWLSDDPADESATRAFLDARIENVMQIEKAKGKVRKLAVDPTAPIAWLAKLRYSQR